jgi:hypothetical protein
MPEMPDAKGRESKRIEPIKIDWEEAVEGRLRASYINSTQTQLGSRG